MPWVGGCLWRFRRDRAGVAAMQFAMIMPVLVFIYVGVVSSFLTARAVQQASNTATTLADLATRVIDMDDDNRDAFFITADALMDRWGGASAYGVSITSLINPVEASPGDPEVDLSVHWSEATKSELVMEDTDLVSFELPEIAEGESMILVVVSGTYDRPLAGFGLAEQVTIERYSVRRPRFVSVVDYVS